MVEVPTSVTLFVWPVAAVRKGPPLDNICWAELTYSR